MNIVLTGFMGTGKSEIGKLLSEKLGWQFFDIDGIIEKQTGLKIAAIFEKNGEPYFRKLETESIKLLSLSDKSIIACGGGAVLKEENMDALEKNGVIVCLSAVPEKIFERLKSDDSRPLLKGANTLKKIEEILSFRQKYYKRCSIAVDTTNFSPVEVVQTILNNPIIRKGLS